MELLGFIAGGLIAIAFIPQVWRLFKLKSAHDISIPSTVLFIFGVLLWIAYGSAFKLIPVILGDGIVLVLLLAILYAKLRYGRGKE